MDAALKLYELGQYSTPTFAEAKFESGKVGFIEMGPWKMSDYEKYSKAYNWEVGYTTAIPFTEGGNSGATLGLYSLVVTNNSNSALAADFVKFVASNDKYQLAFSTPQNLLPTTNPPLRTTTIREMYGRYTSNSSKMSSCVPARPLGRI